MIGVTAIKKSMKKHSAVVALVFVILVFQTMLIASDHGSLFNPMNISNLIKQNAYVVILAIGMLICILTGGNIDLSVGSSVGMLTALASVFMVNMELNVFLSIFLLLFTGIMIGIWQGFWIAFVRIPAFIVTLTGMFMWRGISLLLLRGQTVSMVPDTYLGFLNSFVPSTGASSMIMTVCLGTGIVFCLVFIAVSALGRMRRIKMAGIFLMESRIGFLLKMAAGSLIIMLVCYILGLTRGFPVVFIFLVMIVLAYSFFTQKTVPGRYLYAMGGNEKAARLSGVNTNKVLFFAYVNMGFLTAVAAILTIGRFNSASSADEPLINTLGACYVGGASAYGGVGTVSGVVVGSVFMALLNNGMSMMGVTTNWQRVVQGLVLLFAIALDITFKKRSRR